MKKKCLLALCLLASLNGFSQTVTFDAAAKKMTIEGLTAGTLGATFTAKETEVGKSLRVREDDNDKDSAPVQTLIISGQLNGDDISIIADMARFWIDNGTPTTIYKHGGLQNLDISNAQIVSGGGYYINETITGNVGDGGWAYAGFVSGTHQYNTQNNIVGDLMFFACNQLKTIKIPSTTTKICKYAFSCLSSLNEFTIPASVQMIEGYSFFQAFDLYSFMGPGTGVPVTKIKFEGAEEKIELEANALTQYTDIPNKYIATVITPLAHLGDYVVDDDGAGNLILKENLDAGELKATVTPPGRFWTFSSGVDVVIPDGVNVYTFQIVNDEAQYHILTDAELDVDGKRVVKANNGVLLACAEGAEGNAYDLVAKYNAGITAIATTNANSYSNNSLVPVIRAAHYEPGEYYMLYHGKWVAMASDATKVPACKALLKK